MKNDMLFDTFVETDKRRLVGCTFHVSTDKKKKIKKTPTNFIAVFGS